MPIAHHRQDILEHCRDTAKLVKQLASVLKGLEADVESLRRENVSLRKTVLAAVPQGEWHEPWRPTVPEPEEAQEPEKVEKVTSANPLQTRSTPPPSARIATPPLVMQPPERPPAVTQPAVVQPAVAQFATQPQERMLPATQLAQGPAGTAGAGTAGDGAEGCLARAIDQLAKESACGKQGQHRLIAVLGARPALRRLCPTDSEPMPVVLVPTPEQVQRPMAPTVWAVEQAIWLSAESVDHLADKVQILDKETIFSASTAVDGLNRGELSCPDDFCVVYSASSRGYYMLYRQGLCEKAMALVEEAAPPLNGENEGQTMQRGEDLGATLTQLVRAKDNNDPVQAEELLRQALHLGPVEEAYDHLILAYDRCDQQAKEWTWRALQSGHVPKDECFFSIVNAGCREGAAVKVEETMMHMMHLRIRPSREVFDRVIGLFAKQRNPMKVEEWLLNAGQSGWTPHQAAFEAVVKLYAEVDTMKAEETAPSSAIQEWLRRSQETQYSLPDSCYYPVVMGLMQNGNPEKAEDVLSMMKVNGFPIDDGVLQEVISLHAEAGNCYRAEHLLDSNPPGGCNLDDLRLSIIDSALRQGEVELADRQLGQLQDPEINRTKQVAAALSERGEAPRAKVVLENHCHVSGEAPPEICTMLLSVCANLGDLRGAEAAAQLLLQSGPLSEAQVALLRQTLGDRAEGLLAAPRAQPQKAAPATSRGALMQTQSKELHNGNDSALRDLIARHTNIEIVEDYDAAPSEASPFVPTPVCRGATGEELHWYVGQQAEALPKVKWIVKKPSVMQRVLLEGGLGFAESAEDGDWDTDDLERLVFEMLKLENVRSELGWRVLPLVSMIFWGALKWKVFPGNSLTGAKSNIANTYDVLDSPKLYEKMPGHPAQESLCSQLVVCDEAVGVLVRDEDAAMAQAIA
eukprot:g23586.t1